MDEARNAPSRRMAYHVTTAGAVPCIREKGLLPRIGPRSRKAREERPYVYLFRDLESAEDALMNWLGDELEDEDAVVLKVDASGLVLEDDGFELRCGSPVPPACIIRAYRI